MIDWSTPEGLKRLKEMADQATPGPWIGIVHSPRIVEVKTKSRVLIAWPGFDSAGVPHHQWGPNAMLIAAAREALPQLIDALEKERGR